MDAWECRLTLFQKAFSDDPAAVNNQVMPHDGSHFRYSQLRFLLRVFGINRLPIRHQIHAARIDEVVRNRNAVAHGRETAENVGKRYTQSDIQHVSRQMRNVCKFFIGILQPHFLNPAKHRRR